MNLRRFTLQIFMIDTLSWKIIKLVICVLFTLGGPVGLSAQLQSHELNAHRMGTMVRVVYYCAPGEVASQLQSSILELLDSLIHVFSDYDDSSEINKLASNLASGRFEKMSEPLFELLTRSQYISKISAGKYDVTIGALTSLWRDHLAREEIPSTREIKQAKRASGYHCLEVDSVTMSVRSHCQGLRFDFGGIAKGYIGDQLARYLRSEGVNSFLLDLGGDLVVGDSPPDAEHWNIRINWSDDLAEISNKAIASSGPDYQFFVHEGKKYSHIIDPETGWGVHHPFQVTIISTHGWLSDAVASAAAILEPVETLQIMSTLKHTEGLLQRGNHIYSSPGFYEMIGQEKLKK